MRRLRSTFGSFGNSNGYSSSGPMLIDPGQSASLRSVHAARMSSRNSNSRLAEKVRFLSNAQAYPVTCGVVETLETHMSWIFLTEDLVYKLKKPVRRAFLDFSTIARRRHACEEELRLNRRLAAQTYLGVLPLTFDPRNGFALGGKGRAVDWLVRMRRLPQADMLDERIRTRNLSRRDAGRLSELLADFYDRCEPASEIDGRYARFADEQRINREILLTRGFGTAEAAAGVLADVDRMLHALKPEIDARLPNVVDGHGDLRPEHVCLCNPPQIFDCLEFNPSLRSIDPFDEVTYLGMECDLLGATWIRPLLVGELQRRLKQSVSPELLAFYGAYRALLRARLCMVHLLERPVRHPEKWKPLALRYIEQARRECLNSPFPKGRRSIHSDAGAPRPPQSARPLK
jgi:uncharacterized protein